MAEGSQGTIMKTILIILIVLGYGCILTLSVYFFLTTHQASAFSVPVLIIAINGIFGWLMYVIAKTKKTEWMLFSFIVSFYALIIYYIVMLFVYLKNKAFKTPSDPAAPANTMRE